MGSLISRLRRPKPIEDELDELARAIEEHEARERESRLQERRLVGLLLVYSSLFFVAALGIFYLHFLPQLHGGADRLAAFALIFAIPLAIYVFKRLLHIFFVRRIASEALKLEQLRRKKKQKIEEYKKKTSFETIKAVLEKYDVKEAPPGAPGDARKPGAPGGPAGPVGPGGPPLAPGQQPRPQGPMGAHMQGVPPGGQAQGGPYPPRPRLTRPLTPAHRTAFDRLVDYVVGDGPSNRYALVCANCHCHNGMALQEEFEYLAFRCAYCGYPNPARKARPAPAHVPPSVPPTPALPSAQPVDEPPSHGETGEAPPPTPTARPPSPARMRVKEEDVDAPSEAAEDRRDGEGMADRTPRRSQRSKSVKSE